jgi:serine/threonine-protein kinase
MTEPGRTPSTGVLAATTPQNGAPPAETPDPVVGTIVDNRYVIEGRLGEGGMGVVYAAKHHMIERRVALKVLRKEYANDREILGRFVQEAKTATAIGNPHIVDIFDFGTMPDGSTYFAMELLDGVSLMALVGARIDAKRLARIAMQVCDGLGAAHERGIVHRDLKPDNVFLVRRGSEDFVKILDFGIAKVSGANTKTKLTKAGAVFGTPHYMSPEQAAGTTVDRRADIYALGVILYELAAGQLPFDSDNYMGILTQHMYRAPVPIRALVNNADCPPGLEAIIQKCLGKRPERRYQTAAELSEDLGRFLAGDVPNAVRELMAEASAGYNVPHDYFKSAEVRPILPAQPPGQKKRGAAPLFIAATLLVVVAGALGAAWQYAKSRPAPAPSAAPAPDSAPPAEVAGTASAPALSASADAPPPAGVETVKVELTSKTAGAFVVDGDVERPLPATVEVERGKKRALVVRAPGHTSSVVDVDGSVATVDVKLAKGQGAGPATGARTGKPPTTAAPTGTSKSTGGPVDIWNDAPRKR